MTILRSALENSRLLGPWVWLAELQGSQIAAWLRSSRLLTPVFATGRGLDSMLAAFPRLGSWLQGILILGVVGLFGLLCFSTTGMIGAATLGLCLLTLLGALAFRPAFLKKLTVVDFLVLAFLASALVSTAFSSFWHTSVVGLGKMLTFVAGYIVFRTVSETGDKTITGLMIVLALLGFGESLIGFYQHINHIQPLATWTDQSINPELQMTRIFGTLQPSNPNLLAGFLTLCFAASAGVSLMFFRKKTVVFSLIFIAMAVAILAALVMTGSRGGFLAITGMLGCMFAYLGHLIWRDRELQPFRWMKPAWLAILLVTLLAILGGLLSSEKLRARVVSIFAMREDSSISYRLNVYGSAMRMVHDNPVVGIGPGNGTFKQVYGLYMVPGFFALGSYSVPLEIAVEQGFIGLAVYASLVLVLILRTILLLDVTAVPLRRKLLAGALLTGIIGTVMYGVFDTIWYRPSVNLVFWFMVACLAHVTELRALPANGSKMDQEELAQGAF